MDINAYIESGILELYVAGQLNDKESKEVYEMMLKHPEILQEVLEIEAAIIKLTAAVSPKPSEHILNLIKNKLNFGGDEARVVSMTSSTYNWVTYLGWAAAIIIGAGLLWNVNQNNQLEEKVSNITIERDYLETQLEDTKTDLVTSKEVLNALRDKDVIAVPLGGQGQFENTYAKVYWNKKENTIYLDAQGLPEAPEGKVYQVWSLTLNPLTPTSLGTIADFNEDENKIFNIENTNESQAFGITLEPAGGSKTPTMEQLYTLGMVSQA